MNDDDFKIVEEKDEFQSDESQNDVYALSSEKYDASTDKASAPPTIGRPQDEDKIEVYGIVEPTPSPLENESEQSRLDKKKKSLNRNKGKKKSTNQANDDFDDNFDEESFSLEDVYKRKREERARRGEDVFAGVEFPPLPERPFWDGIFKPFWDIGFIARLLASIGAAYLPIFLAIHFFDYSFAEEVKEMLNRNDGVNALSAFYECVWKDKIVITLLCVFWGVFATPFVECVFMSTASGVDKIEDWPEYNFVSGLGSFLLFVLYVALAGLPGAILFQLLGLSGPIGGTLSTLCLTPIFVLSRVQNDAPFAVLSRDVLVGVKRLQKEWLQFWGISLIVVLACLIIELFAIWYSVNPESVKPSVQRVAISALIVSFVVTFGPCLYFRYLGRFAWILENDYRKRQDEQDGVDEETQESENNGVD